MGECYISTIVVQSQLNVVQSFCLVNIDKINKPTPP